MIRCRHTAAATLAAVLSTTLVGVAIAPVASATVQSDVLQTTLVPAGDTDGAGSGTLEIRTKDEAVCFDIQTTNVTTPITDATITFGPSGETAFELIVPFSEQDAHIASCTRVSLHSTPTRRDLNRLVKDPGAYYLHLYNAEHPSGAGAVQGQLTGSG